MSLLGEFLEVRVVSLILQITNSKPIPIGHRYLQNSDKENSHKMAAIGIRAGHKTAATVYLHLQTSTILALWRQLSPKQTFKKSAQLSAGHFLKIFGG